MPFKLTSAVGGRGIQIACRLCSKGRERSTDGREIQHAYRREYGRKHRIKDREYKKKWANANRTRVVENVRKWRRDNTRFKEEQRRYMAKWRKANTERVKMHAERRCVRKLGATGSHTPHEWEVLKGTYNRRCVYCGRSDRSLTKDHMTPLTRGGTDLIENILPVCKLCNSAKRTLTYDEFMWRQAHGTGE